MQRKFFTPTFPVEEALAPAPSGHSDSINEADATVGMWVAHDIATDGCVMPSTVDTNTEEGEVPLPTGRRIVCIRGEKAEPLILPNNAKKEDNDCLCGQPQTERDTVMVIMDCQTPTPSLPEGRGLLLKFFIGWKRQLFC